MKLFSIRTKKSGDSRLFSNKNRIFTPKFKVFLKIGLQTEGIYDIIVYNVLNKM